MGNGYAKCSCAGSQEPPRGLCGLCDTFYCRACAQNHEHPPAQSKAIGDYDEGVCEMNSDDADGAEQYRQHGESEAFERGRRHGRAEGLVRCIQKHTSKLRKRADELDAAAKRLAPVRGAGSTEGHRAASKTLRNMATSFEDPTGLLLPGGKVLGAWEEVEDGIWHRVPYEDNTCTAYADGHGWEFRLKPNTVGSGRSGSPQIWNAQENKRKADLQLFALLAGEGETT